MAAVPGALIFGIGDGRSEALRMLSSSSATAGDKGDDGKMASGIVDKNPRQWRIGHGSKGKRWHLKYEYLTILPREQERSEATSRRNKGGYM